MFRTVSSFVAEKVKIYLKFWSDLQLCWKKIKLFIFFTFATNSNTHSLTKSFGKLPCLHFILLIQHNCTCMWRECRSQSIVKIFPNRAIEKLPKALVKFVKYNMEVGRLHNFSSISLLLSYFCSNISAGVWPMLRGKKHCCWKELGLKTWKGLSLLHHVILPSFRLWVRRSQYLVGVQGLFTAKFEGFSRTGFWASCCPRDTTLPGTTERE